MREEQQQERFKAMRLDANDVLVGVEELQSEADLTERHVDLRPYGGECDRPANEYRWNREAERLEPLRVAERLQPAGVSLEQAVAALIVALGHAGVTVPEISARWAASFLNSVEGQRLQR
ncbi:MAG: hypothetical protein EPO27_10650 [Betaproteobacteria bacterium]|nr:MAG: hypothetical protein EPO27_10650 [Betaproteobacteria bacterium]